MFLVIMKPDLLQTFQISLAVCKTQNSLPAATIKLLNRLPDDMKSLTDERFRCHVKKELLDWPLCLFPKKYTGTHLIHEEMLA